MVHESYSMYIINRTLVYGIDVNEEVIDERKLLVNDQNNS